MSYYPRFSVYKDADLFDFINAPVGKGLPIKEKLRPLIAGSLFDTAYGGCIMLTREDL